MKIAFLHMTMGLVNRGSEIAVDTVARGLSKNHNVLMLQSGHPTQAGDTTHKKYKIVRVFPLDVAPATSPINVFDKLLYKLHLDKESQSVVDFTRAALPHIETFSPDIVVAINGPLQIKIIKRYLDTIKLVAFGHAGIGYHDKHAIQSGPDLFITLTPEAKSWAENFARTTTRVEYIPNPLIPNNSKIRSFDKLTLKKPIILTVSALSKYKNIDNVISALSLTNYSFVLIGDGEESGNIAQSLSQLKNEFKWIKHLGREEILNYYNQADVFCFTPDPQEAFGMVYLEAMSAGLPIVASDDMVRRTLIGHDGVFVDPHDPKSIKHGLDLAVTKRRVNYQKILTQFETNHVIKQIESSFYALLK